MPRTIWDWLDIEPTTDKSAIKKAYAEQAKKYHPEENPDEALELRAAYKEAMAQASAPQPDNSVGRKPELSSSAKQVPESDTTAEEAQSPEQLFRFSMPESDATVEETQSKEQLFQFSMPEAKSDDRAEADNDMAKGDMPEQQYRYDEMSPEKAARVQKLISQLMFVYENNVYRWIPKIWGMVLEFHSVPEDLNDPKVISELLAALAQLPLLSREVCSEITKRLFDAQDKNAVMLYLRKRWTEIQNALDQPQIKAARLADGYGGQGTQNQFRARAAGELYGTQHKYYKRMARIYFIVIALILIMGIAIFITSFIVNKKLSL